MTFYMRHLPHWRQDGATYFVTFRLDDSLPRDKVQQLQDIRREWEESNPPPRDEKALEGLARRMMGHIEGWLDQGMGSCVMKELDCARIVADAMHHFDGDRCELDCYVVMPNHVHAVVRPLRKDVALEKLLQSWKRYTARRINDCTGNSGAMWQEESYDRIVRDEEHLWRVIQYIGNNPAKAGLPHGTALRWIRPDWVKLGWKFEE